MNVINMSPNPLLSELIIALRLIGKYEPEPHKAKAYDVAVNSLLRNADKFNELAMHSPGGKAFKELDGIGDSISLKIEEFLMTGKIHKLEELKAANEHNK
jgi:DNA polymerase/3'-5' exonuclease PolX